MIFKGAMGTASTILAAPILAALMGAVLVWSGSATANEIDLSTWTCKQFQSANKDEVTLVLAWLDGYYRAEDDPPVIDADQLGANAKKLGAYCAAHPDTKLITAADTLFERE
jgi:acid stress chaperone HdeB